MTIYVFLIDNSASMAQASYAGASMLDLAKNFVEIFQKARQKESSKDRFMIMTCDDYPANIKVGWKEGMSTFMEHLKKLQPLGTCPLETALGRAFWFLNCNRALSDLPGFGWNVAKAEPANIIILTDGIFTSGPFFAPEKIKHPSSDFYTEVYRPDQRVFSVLFRVPARALPMVPPFETTTSGGLAHFCLSTGGKCFTVSNSRHVPIAVEAVIQKSLVFVKVRFSYSGPDLDSEVKNGSNEDSNSKHETLPWKEVMNGILRIPRKDDNRYPWPISENFWADYNTLQLPPRPDVPKVIFTFDSKAPPVWKDGNLFDRYELEPSPLTHFILERKTGHYPIYVDGSGKKVGRSPSANNKYCGYLVAETTKGYFASQTEYKLAESGSRVAVFLYLVPYNYPVLLSLLDDVDRNFSKKQQLNLHLRQKFVDYVITVPVYYFVTPEGKSALLKTLLRSLGLPEDDFNKITYPSRIFQTVATWRANLRKEYEYSFNISQKIPDDILKSKVHVETLFSRSRVNCRDYTGDGPAAFIIEHEPLPKVNPAVLFTTPRLIPRSSLISHLTKIRVNYNLYGRDLDLHVLQGGMPGTKIKLHDAEELINKPIKNMGEYEKYNQSAKEYGYGPLREVMPRETTSHAFGNPFKLDKKVVAVDEIGEDGSPDANQKPSKEPIKAVPQRRRVVRILNASDFTRLRERRGTFSETGSLASLSRCTSPFSDGEELDLNGLDEHHKADIPSPNGSVKESSPTPSITNGFSNLILHKRRSPSSGGEDPSNSECLPPPSKKLRESGNSGGLNYKNLISYKVSATKIARQLKIGTGSQVVAQLKNICESLIRSDQIAVLMAAEDALQRLKRNAIYSAVSNYRKKLQNGL